MKKSSSRSQAFDSAAISAGIIKEYEDLVRKTDTLIASVDAEYAFQALVTYNLSKLSKGYTETEHGMIPNLIELAAFHLYPRFGQGGTREPGQIQATIDALTEQNQLRGLATAFSVDRADKELASLQVHLRLYAEAVRGSSYPPQTRRRIEQIQGPFNDWFRAKAGIGPTRALEVLDAFEKALNDNFQSHRQKFRRVEARMGALMPQINRMDSDRSSAAETERLRDAAAADFTKFMEEIPLAFPVSFEQVERIVAGLTREEWDRLRDMIGLTPESREMIGQPRDIKDRPVYFLSGDRFIIIDLSSVYDALFEGFDRLTRTDFPFRDKYYVPNLSHWMEEEAGDFLLRLFPQSAVFRQLTYPDPDNRGGETELDAAVAWGPFLVLVEVKGKQFRPRSRVGDPSRLRDDLKDSIEEAFEQARRATRFVEANAAATFIEKGTGRKLVIQKESIRRIFPVSVTLHHFGGLATQLALLKGIGLFKDSAYPWSVSLADLDLITRFAGSPDVFLHYVQRRLDLQRSEKEIMGDELDVFGLYLDSRLHPSQYWGRKTEGGEAFDRFMLSGGSERFDEWFKAEEGSGEERPDIRLKLPPKFLALIEELRRRDDDGARWIAFALLGLSQETVSRIENDLGILREQAKPDWRIRRITINDDGLVVSVLAARGLPTNDLRRHTAFRGSIEKFRLKTTASVSLGIDAGDITKPFDFAFWIEGPWEEDPVMEAALKKERPQLMLGQKLPGRNELCFCGSGKKFKKCCLGKATILHD
jgi:hypothetical protein